MTDDILAKIRKLLAKAEDQAATQAESELYTAKAARLIADYGIDQALVEQDVPGGHVVGDRVVHLDAPYARDKAELLSTVASVLRCRAVQIVDRTTTGKQFSVHLFGHRADLDRTDLLFTSLLLQSTRWLTRTPIPRGEHKAAFRRSWLAGFRIAIARRLTVAEQQAEDGAADRRSTTGRSASLVLADRSAQVTQAMHEAYPRLGTARPRGLSGSGTSSGYAAGQRADLGGPRVDARSQNVLTGR